MAKIPNSKTSEMFLCITWGCISETISVVGDDFRLLTKVNGAAQLMSIFPSCHGPKTTIYRCPIKGSI